MSFYDVIMKITLGLFDTISGGFGSTPVVAYSRVTGVRVGFVWMTTSSPAHPPPRGQGHQNGERARKPRRWMFTCYSQGRLSDGLMVENEWKSCVHAFKKAKYQRNSWSFGVKKKKNLIMGWLKRSDKGIQESQLNPCKQKEKKTP